MRNAFTRILLAASFILSAVLLPPVQLAPAALAADVAKSVTVDQEKLVVAKDLTDWLQATMLEKKAIAAVVSRKGGPDVKKRDFTGMAHSALAIYDPRAQTWILYQIMNVPKSGEPVSELWRTAPVDFFYGQTGYEKNALLLIPDSETQRRLYDGILSGKTWKLAFTQKYNLLSQYDTFDSLNCNKWILMAIAAARIDNYDPKVVLATIRQGFDPARLRINFIEKEFAKRKPNVRRDELPSFGAIKTVTPQSLYQSGMFEERLFASQMPSH